MKRSEFKAFRDELVGYEKEHPEVAKAKRNAWDSVPTVVPPTDEARAYWRLRNGSQGLARQLANFDEDAACRLGAAYGGPADYELDEEQERLVSKWMDEFERIKR